MVKGKLVHLSANEPVGWSARALQPWSDTYVKTSQGKGWLKLAPTICGRLELLADLSLTEEVQAKNPDLDYGEELKNLRAAVEATGRGECYFYQYEKGGSLVFDLPDDLVSRETIERSVAEYLCGRHGIRSCRFKWRRPRYCIGPLTVSNAGIIGW